MKNTQKGVSDKKSVVTPRLSCKKTSMVSARLVYRILASRWEAGMILKRGPGDEPATNL